MLIHKNIGVRNSYGFFGSKGWSVGVSLDHYFFQRVVDKYTKAVQVSDKVEFCHHYLIQPQLTPADRLLCGVNTLMCYLKDSLAVACDAQLVTIQAL